MSFILRHRGPDDEGVYADRTCALGHRRLAIIDLSAAGRQPFFSDDGRYVLVYNGEIYNYLELRAELRSRGWHFETETDTEVLLKAYRHYGPDCLSRFNGMFAFALYDTRREQLFLARDRMGIKPLYYLQQGEKFYFASEIKALLSIPGVAFSVNYQSLFDYLVFNRTDVFDETFLNEIKRIPNGHHGFFDKTGLVLRQWWHPQQFVTSGADPEQEDPIGRISEIMASAVKLRMRSDVPVGSCLSGGLDSSILVGLLYAAGLAAENYPTFTAAFPGHPIDETVYVDELNRIYPFVNYRIYPDARGAYKNLMKFVHANDEPTTNPSFYSQYEVMRKAAECGVTVLLDGQGGDENFAGYHYFHGFNMYGLLQARKLPLFCKELVGNLIRRQHRSAYQTLLFQLLPDRYRKALLYRTVPYIHADFFHQYIDTSRVYTEFFDAENLNMSLVRHFQYKLEHLLRMEDRNSMAFSLEARVPYLDYRLVEFMLSISGDLKIKDGETKYLQKKALARYTSASIRNRTDKIGFGTPGDDWMQCDPWPQRTTDSYNALRTRFDDVFTPEGQLPAIGFDRWKINQLATWQEVVFN